MCYQLCDTLTSVTIESGCGLILRVYVPKQYSVHQHLSSHKPKPMLNLCTAPFSHYPEGDASLPEVTHTKPPTKKPNNAYMTGEAGLPSTKQATAEKTAKKAIPMLPCRRVSRYPEPRTSSFPLTHRRCSNAPDLRAGQRTSWISLLTLARRQ